MNSGDAPQHGAAVPGWLTEQGANSDVVISSRVRLARNLAAYSFAPRATREDRLAILHDCKAQIGTIPISDDLVWIDLHTRPSVERTLLMERHMISRQHALGKLSSGRGGATEPRAVVMSMPGERLAIMVNEEDHLRISALRPGLDLGGAMDDAYRVDDMLEDNLEYAFSHRFGYLTTCPTNVGTGMRMSVMLHLSALALTGELDKARRAAEDMCLAVRGLYGEGSEADGDLYQVSNQTTLGRTERSIRDELMTRIIPSVIDFERSARDSLMERRRRWTEDQIFRAVALLSGARLMPISEAMSALSKVRLGIALDIVKGIDLAGVAKLMLLVQPAHLQRAAGQKLRRDARLAARADLIRQALRHQA